MLMIDIFKESENNICWSLLFGSNFRDKHRTSDRDAMIRSKLVDSSTIK